MLLAAPVILACSTLSVQSVIAQQSTGLTEPIYRVAHEEPAGETPATQIASRTVSAPLPAGINLTQRPGEHPLNPSLRFAQQSLIDLDKNIKDYSAILYKQERIGGELLDQEVAFIKVRHQPFGVYMFFLSKQNKGREVVYSDMPDGSIGKLNARDCGFKKRLGVFSLDPNGRLAMGGQKYPITKLGVRELTKELITVASNDVKYGECDVRTAQTAIGPRNNKRPVTLIEVTHPVPRPNTFRFHKAQVYIDNELRVPIRYVAKLWPTEEGGEAPLEEAYTYVNLKINNGFTDIDFSKDNPEYFKP
ncbi:DUF1571 domain-containing protein [Adhaeretor mobilis]|nr:DUF1571 domain-containing protein [Adhaeretor mobilis]